MGARAGTALKFLQWFLRGVQFACAALILGVYSYFLAALANHDLRISNMVRAVEGISGAAVLYTLLGLIFLCCIAGLAFTSFIAIILDVAFIGAFIYVAVANKNGAGSCSGYLDTPFGKGQDNKVVDGSDGFTALPSFHTACRLQTACLSVAIIAIFFFIFSILTEVALARHHRKEKRFGPGPGNDYTSGYGSRGGFFSRLFRRRDVDAGADENMLPKHTTPDELGIGGGRHSYATAETATVPGAGSIHQQSGTATSHHYGNSGAGTGGNVGYNDPDHLPTASALETGYGYPNAGNAAYNGRNYQQQTPPRDYRYDDGIYDRS